MSEQDSPSGECTYKRAGPVRGGVWSTPTDPQTIELAINLALPNVPIHFRRFNGCGALVLMTPLPDRAPGASRRPPPPPARRCSDAPAAPQRRAVSASVYTMTKCVKPLRHLVRLSAKSFLWTTQNAPFGRLGTTCC
jgi:hypothetical protein